MSDTITIRSMRRSEMPEVLDLLRVSLGETPLLRRTSELFTWKHLDNPFGPSILLVAEAQGRIVGLRAFMRWELTTRHGERLRCVRAVDTATHPEFRRRGVFRRLTLEAVDAARDDGVDLVFNTPNERSGRGYLAMGWSAVGPIRVLARVRPLRLLRRPAPVGAGQSGESPGGEVATGTLPDWGPARGLATRRTAEYLQWRFSAHPAFRYVRVDAAGGSALLRPNQRRGRAEMVLSDVFGERPAAAIRRAARTSHADYMVAAFSPRSRQRRAAMRAGMVPLPVAALRLVARPLRPLSVDVADRRMWHLAMSDLELL